MAENVMQVVKGLDVQRYLGRWYEIATFAPKFQAKDARNTRVTYSVKNDCSVHVLVEFWSCGKKGYIEGTAYVADPLSDEVKHKVKFLVPPFLPIFPVVTDHWILHIDDGYQYVLIGQPSRKCLWILCRQNHMDDEIYNELLKKAENAGYDVKKLHKTPQTDPPPEEDAAPKDTKGVWWLKSIFGK